VTEPAPKPAGQPNPARPADGRESGIAWETHFHSLPPRQQQEVLSLAERQGVLYAHQLPPISNGACTDPARGLLPAILAGRRCHLQKIRHSELTAADDEVDETKREAVRMALDTPDGALIQGLPGTGQSRVAAEILTQAALCGWRVLFVSSIAAG